MLWRRKWQPTPVFLPGDSHGQRSLAGYSSQGRKKSAQLSTQTGTENIEKFHTLNAEQKSKHKLSTGWVHLHKVQTHVCHWKSALSWPLDAGPWLGRGPTGTSWGGESWKASKSSSGWQSHECIHLAIHHQVVHLQCVHVSDTHYTS